MHFNLTRLLTHRTTMDVFAVFFLFSCFGILTEAHSAHSARMVFTEKETAMKRLHLPEHHVPVHIFLEGPGTVTAVGNKRLISFNFQNPQQAPVVREVLWKECIDRRQMDCNYNITVAHKREDANKLFLCGTNGRQTLCCEMNLSEQSPMCVPSGKMKQLSGRGIKEGELSAFVESKGSVDLYITHSGSGHYVGIHRFGPDRVSPANQNKEHHYVGLVLSQHKDNPMHDKVYAFYKEKNRDKGLDGEMWLPFVTQVCMADIGGPKNSLQFTWTSQMNAKLFCGDPDRRQYFSELVDVATVDADHWQDTRVYALFRNEWGMSAVCVYTIKDIDHVFKTSLLKDVKDDQGTRSRECVDDSTKIPSETLRMIEKKTPEMEQWVKPVNDSGPLLVNHHNYTRIYIDSYQHKKNNDHPVLFLSLNHGGIHKVMKNNAQTFIIAEYRPFNHTAHIVDVVLHPSSKKLYVNSRRQLVQLNVANCARYGDRCEECVLARDPYCGWNGTQCTPETHGTVQDVAQGNYSICASSFQLHGRVSRYSTNAHVDKDVDSIRLPPQSKYFLQCPVTSHHARYTWHHPEGSTPCSLKEQQCLHLIDSMGHDQVGAYKCVSEEMGYSRVLAQHQLQLEGRAAGHSSGPLVWVCLMAVLIKSLM